MSDSSNLDLFTASLDEQSPRTPRQNGGYSRRTFFSRRELDGNFCFSPSAWKTPERRHTGETPFKLGTPHAHRASPSSSFDTPSAYRAAVGPSRTPRGMPGLHQSPMGNIGITPARVMGPFTQRDLFSEATPPSPSSVVAHRKIITPKRLRPGFSQAQRPSDGTNLLDASLFGGATTPARRPTAPPSGLSAIDTPPPQYSTNLLPPSNILPPKEVAPIQSTVREVDEMDGSGENEVATKEDGEEENTEEDGEDEDESVPYHTQSLTEHIHSQHGAQDGSTDDDGNVWLPFPYDRDNLAAYLEQGLSLRYLFPSSTQGARIRCEAELELTGRLWRRTHTCNESKGSLESYQRHIKSKHLGVKRGKEVGLGHIVNTVWGCNMTMPRQPKTWLRVHPWDPQQQDFPLAA